MKTTIEEIMKHSPCSRGIQKFKNKYERTSGEVSFKEILESNGIEDAIWCLRVLSDCYLDVLKFKLKCARHVEHLDTSGNAKNYLNVLENLILDKQTREELAISADVFVSAAAAYAAANAAAYAAYAYAAYANAATASYASYASITSASYASIVSASYASVTSAANAAAAGAAGAGAAGAYAAYAAYEREYQTKIFIEIFCKEDEPNEMPSV